MKNNLALFERKIKFIFKNKNLLRQVFVHRSYLNENIAFDLDNNERLEFLGDAVLELIVTEHLYRSYKNPEGELTNWRSALVKGESLATIAKNLSVGDFLYLSKGEEKSGGKARQLILANTLEALIGAIYLDQGLVKAKEFVEKYLLGNLSEIIKKGLYIDPKSRLQEITQARLNLTPIYKVLAEYGPDHAKSFSIGVFINNRLIGEGSGSSKQAAEEAAALSALENLEHNHIP